MTLMPKYKQCPKCKKLYSLNPDVGKVKCPYCEEKARKRFEKIMKIMEKINKTGK